MTFITSLAAVVVVSLVLMFIQNEMVAFEQPAGTLTVWDSVSVCVRP